MTVQELTISKLQERIKSGKLILVDFYADWNRHSRSSLVGGKM